jgi:outer membrane biosynthesis protein TonB
VLAGRRENPEAVPKAPLRRCIALAGVALVGFACGAPAAAAAAPLGEPPRVEVPQPPVLPAPVPTPPKVQIPSSPKVEVPAPPKVEVPDVPKPVSPPPPPASPQRSGKVTDVASSGGDAVSAAAGEAGLVGDSSGSLTKTARDAPHLETTPGRESAGAGSARTNGAARPPGAPGHLAPSIRRAVTAPLRRLAAYVWPAIALGPIGEAFAIPLTTRLERLERSVSLPMLGLAPPLSSLSGNVEVGSAPERIAPAPGPSSSPPFPLNALAPDGGGMSLLVTMATALAVLIGVVALARLTVGEDLFSTRWLH